MRGGEQVYVSVIAVSPVYRDHDDGDALSGVGCEYRLEISSTSKEDWCPLDWETDADAIKVLVNQDAMTEDRLKALHHLGRLFGMDGADLLDEAEENGCIWLPDDDRISGQMWSPVQIND